MNLLPFSWSSPAGEISARLRGGGTDVLGERQSGILRLRCANGSATYRLPSLFSPPWRKRAIARGCALLPTVRIRGWIPSDATVQEDSAHSRLAAETWMATHGPTLAQAIEALQTEGDPLPWGLYADAKDLSPSLCVQLDKRYVLALLPIS